MHRVPVLLRIDPRIAKRAAWIGFALLQLGLVLCAADRLGHPDPAEVGRMALGDAWAAGESPSILRSLRAGPNAPHGAHLLVSLLYAALAVPLGGGSYLALKLVAVAFATLAFAAWTEVADELGGRGAGVVAALLIVFCAPSWLSARLIAWGSHPEATAMLGVAALVAIRTPASGRGALLVGGVLGGTVAMSRLAVVVVGVLLAAWGWRERRHLGRVALAGGVAVGVAAGWMGVCGAWGASVTEAPGNTPLGLLATAGAGFPAALAEVLPLRLVPPRGLHPAPLDRVAFLGAAACAVLAVRAAPRKGMAGALLLGAPAAHLAFLALTAPQRPHVPARYLLPVWPLVAVGIAVAAARTRGPARGLAAATAALWVGIGAWVQLPLLDPGRAARFFEYRPDVYAPLDIGKVDYDTAPAVNDFLARRPDRRGFRLAPGSGAGQDLLMRPPPHPVDPRAIAHALAGESDPTVLENVGWGLAVFAADRPGARRSVLSALTPSQRTRVASGIGMGFRACGRSLDLWESDPDAEAIRDGARRIEASEGPPLPPAGSSTGC